MDYRWVRVDAGGPWEPARRLETGFYDICGREGPAVVFEEGAPIDADGAMSEAEFRTLHGFLDAVEMDWRRTLASLDATVSSVDTAIARMASARPHDR